MWYKTELFGYKASLSMVFVICFIGVIMMFIATVTEDYRVVWEKKCEIRLDTTEKDGGQEFDDIFITCNGEKYLWDHFSYQIVGHIKDGTAKISYPKTLVCKQLKGDVFDSTKKIECGLK